MTAGYMISAIKLIIMDLVATDLGSTWSETAALLILEGRKRLSLFHGHICICEMDTGNTTGRSCGRRSRCNPLIAEGLNESVECESLPGVGKAQACSLALFLAVMAAVLSC